MTTRYIHTCYRILDPEKSTDFYVNKLGMETVRDDPMGPDARWVQVKPRQAETSIVFVKGFADWAPEKVGRLQSITLWSENAEATVEELRAQDVAISQEPTPQPWGMVEVRFMNQDGNEFLLYGPTGN